MVSNISLIPYQPKVVISNDVCYIRGDSSPIMVVRDDLILRILWWDIDSRFADGLLVFMDW